MNQKYEITDIVHPQYPWLHRIGPCGMFVRMSMREILAVSSSLTENLSQEGQCWVANNAVAAEESYISGDAIMWDYSCARGCAVNFR